MPTLYCRYIKTNGRRCLSPALRGEACCYFHSRAQASRRALRPEPETILHPLTTPDGRQQEFQVAAGPQPARLSLKLPALEDRESIQVALSLAVQALAEDSIDPKRAYTLLYGLHVASRNAAQLDLQDRRVVTETVHTDTGEELAPDEDPVEIAELLEAQEEEEEAGEW